MRKTRYNGLADLLKRAERIDDLMSTLNKLGIKSAHRLSQLDKKVHPGMYNVDLMNSFSSVSKFVAYTE